jgi:outer membrane protein assembly factor BamD (BamD/ComL family)
VVIIEGTHAIKGTLVQSSGCCIDRAGYILTTGHQVLGVNDLKARMADGSTYQLSLVEVDRDREIALLKSDRPLPVAVAMGNADTLRSGSDLVSIATPNHLDFTTVTGIVSNTNRTYQGHPVIQSDFRVSPGSSGGPVFDKNGALVGMVIGKLASDNWVTVVNPVNNAFPLLDRHGVAYGKKAVAREEDSEFGGSEDMELVPAPGISAAEFRAVEAYNRGVTASDPAEKVAAYGLSVKLLPAFFEAWFNLGVAQTAAGNKAGAEQAYKEAGALRKDAVQVKRNLGRLLLRQRRYNEAIRSFEEAVMLRPDSPQTYNDLGEAYRKGERLIEAVAAFKKVIELEPGHEQVHYNLALAYANSHRYRDAIIHFEQYLTLNPTAADAANVRTWLQQLEQQQGRTQ